MSYGELHGLAENGLALSMHPAMAIREFCPEVCPPLTSVWEL
jgi:hypothetical protein